MSESAHLDPYLLQAEDLSFATDLYQITMAAAYHARWAEAMPQASFELFVRRLPEGRNFLVFAGLEQALATLRALRFSPEQISFLRTLPPLAKIGDDFFQHLAHFRFRGDVWAMAEGTVFFPHEPVLRVTGSLLEAQLVETVLLSILNFQSAIASKAARVRIAAGGRQLAEFGGRRAHGPQAAAWVARAAYLAGFESTSNVLAGQRLGIPVVGTMAHSYVMSFDREIDAFRHYHQTFPENSILLVDTYDTLEGVRTALATALPFRGIRLDSGDLAELARQARGILDAGGRSDALIFASSDLDEHRIAALLAQGAPIDAFGVGTRLASCVDAPYLSGVYKLVEMDDGDGWEGRWKEAAGKVSYPGRKQVLRRTKNKLGGTLRSTADKLGGTLSGSDGMVWDGDRIVASDRVQQEGLGAGEEALLAPVMRQGACLGTPSLESAREHCRSQLAALPEGLRSLDKVEPYSVEIDRSVLAKRPAAGRSESP
jgi:nicotinate phosphoribosyltransferase